MINGDASKDEFATSYIAALPAKLRDYAVLYWQHLRHGTTQPNLNDDLTFAQGQAVRIRLVTFL